MIAGIELGKNYAQICVKTDRMKEPESITLIAGTENYCIPMESDIEKKSELQEVFRKYWKLIAPYGTKESLEYLVFCLDESTETLRENLLEIAEIYDIPKRKIRFMEKKECFCAYVFHQSVELLSRSSLLIENKGGTKEKYILYKRSKTVPAIAEVRDISEKTLEDIFMEHGISSVFLVGDDFEEAWMQQNMKLLKNGKRVFAGKNLFVKGACYRGMELKDEYKKYLYLGKEKVCCNIALKTTESGRVVYLPVVEGGRNWYESNTSLDILLLEEPKLEFVIFPMNGKEKQKLSVELTELPERPKKTTKLRIQVEFISPSNAKLSIRDLGFGELFPASDMNYEGELQWEQ